MKTIQIILCIFLTQNGFAEDLTGKVVSIADGDTVTILNNNQQTKIRLAEIDTPEKNQPYGKKAKKALSDFIFGKTVRIEIDTIDRYGRTVGTIFLNNLNINKEMVKAGHAWVYVKYAKDKTLFDLEKNAKGYQITLSDQTKLSCQLLIGADGAQSQVRRLAGIDTSDHDYQQQAIIANIACEKSFDGA